MTGTPSTTNARTADNANANQALGARTVINAMSGEPILQLSSWFDRCIAV
jgi:hypothetical protein